METQVKIKKRINKNQDFHSQKHKRSSIQIKKMNPSTIIMTNAQSYKTIIFPIQQQQAYIKQTQTHINQIWMFDSEQEILEQKLIFPRKQPHYIQSKQNLQRIRQISRGTFGEVHQYYNPLKNQFYAVKKMKFNGRKDYKSIDQITREIDLLYRVNSPYLIRLLDHFQDQNFQGPSYVYLVMEFVDGKDLCQALFKPRIQLQYKILCEMIRDICQGLEYLHVNKIIHRDIKLENIMLSSKGTIKIIDLGQSNFYGDGISRKTTRGTKSYFSPEIANHDEQDDKVDVWCLGVIIYELVCLDSPFRGVTEKQLMENIRRFRYPIPQKIKQEKDLLDLFSKIFTWHPDRISIAELKNHTWIKKNTQENATPKYENLFKQYQIIDYRKWLTQQIQKIRASVLANKEENKNIEKMLQKCKAQIYQINKK